MPHHPFRLACSASMFTEVNEQDARAAMKVWIMTIARERGIPVDPNPRVYQDAEELIGACRTYEVDGIGFTTPEFPRLHAQLNFDELAVGSKAGHITEEYALLVHRDSGLVRLDQLKGRNLCVMNTPRMSLAMIWLDTALLEAQLSPASNYFGTIKHNQKATQVALPVFFRQADACLMTRMSFEVMCELNPQLKKQLRSLATSPELLPSGFAFRAGYQSPSREQLLTEMEHLGNTEAGRQILTLTQADRIESRPLACLTASLELLAKQARLCRETNALTANLAGTESGVTTQGTK